MFLLLFFLVRGTWRVYERSHNSLEKKNTANIELFDLADKQQKLNQEIVRLDSRVGIEEELRLRYSLSKSDEKVIVIIDEEDPVPESEPINDNFLQKTRALFKKINLLE